LEDKVSEVKWSAIAALGAIGDERAISPLTNLSDDKDIGIGQKAKYSIKLIKAANNISGRTYPMYFSVFSA